MKVTNSINLNFKGLEPAKETKNNIPEKCIDIQPQVKLTKPSVEHIRAYNIIDPLLKMKRGIENAILSPDKDSYQLTYIIKSPIPHTEKVKFIYKINGDNDTLREAFSSEKDTKTGTFEINIPVLKRKDNSIIPELEITSVEYFDDTNSKINEDNPENMVICPKSIINPQKTRITTINGKTFAGEFDAISEGTSIGKLVKMDYSDIIRYKGKEPIIAILSEHKDMNEMFMQIADGTFMLPMNVKGLIMNPPNYKQGYCMTDMLGHAVSRLRGRKIFALIDNNILKNIEQNYYNNPSAPYVKFELGMDKMSVSGMSKIPEEDKSKVAIPKYQLINDLLSSEDENYTPETVGLKAYNLGALKKLQKEGGYIVPRFFVVPAGVWDYAKRAPENISIYGNPNNPASDLGEYHYYSQKADATEFPEVELKGLRRLVVEDMTIPKEIRTQLKEKVREIFNMEGSSLSSNKCLIARSSFNGEDSPLIATQGLYDSFPGIRTDENLFRGIKEVWASKWSDLAYMSRRNHKIPHKQIQPNVIIQEVVPVDYTFTINTADPRQNDKNKIVCQLSQGVYSGFPNSPYIFEYDKNSGRITRTALATKKRTKPIEKVIMDDFTNLKYDKADYSNDPLNMPENHYLPVMQKIFDVAKFIEEKFGGVPQDIEGGVIFKENPETGEIKPEIHIWQTRDVHLLKR